MMKAFALLLTFIAVISAEVDFEPKDVLNSLAEQKVKQSQNLKAFRDVIRSQPSSTKPSIEKTNLRTASDPVNYLNLQIFYSSDCSSNEIVNVDFKLDSCVPTTDSATGQLKYFEKYEYSGGVFYHGEFGSTDYTCSGSGSWTQLPSSSCAYDGSSGLSYLATPITGTHPILVGLYQAEYYTLADCESNNLMATYETIDATAALSFSSSTFGEPLRYTCSDHNTILATQFYMEGKTGVAKVHLKHPIALGGCYPYVNGITTAYYSRLVCMDKHNNN